MHAPQQSAQRAPPLEGWQYRREWSSPSHEKWEGDSARSTLAAESIKALHQLQAQARQIRIRSRLSEADHNKLFEAEAKDLKNWVTTTFPTDMANHYRRLRASEHMVQETISYLRSRNERFVPTRMDTQRGMLQLLIDRIFQSRADGSTLHNLHSVMTMQPAMVSGYFLRWSEMVGDALPRLMPRQEVIIKLCDGAITQVPEFWNAFWGETPVGEVHALDVLLTYMELSNPSKSSAVTAILQLAQENKIPENPVDLVNAGESLYHRTNSPEAEKIRSALNRALEDDPFTDPYEGIKLTKRSVIETILAHMRPKEVGRRVTQTVESLKNTVRGRHLFSFTTLREIVNKAYTDYSHQRINLSFAQQAIDAATSSTKAETPSARRAPMMIPAINLIKNEHHPTITDKGNIPEAATQAEECPNCMCPKHLMSHSPSTCPTQAADKEARFKPRGEGLLALRPLFNHNRFERLGGRQPLSLAEWNNLHNKNGGVMSYTRPKTGDTVYTHPVDVAALRIQWKNPNVGWGDGSGASSGIIQCHEHDHDDPSDGEDGEGASEQHDRDDSTYGEEDEDVYMLKSVTVLVATDHEGVESAEDTPEIQAEEKHVMVLGQRYPEPFKVKQPPMPAPVEQHSPQGEAQGQAHYVSDMAVKFATMLANSNDTIPMSSLLGTATARRKVAAWADQNLALMMGDNAKATLASGRATETQPITACERIDESSQYTGKIICRDKVAHEELSILIDDSKEESMIDADFAADWGLRVEDGVAPGVRVHVNDVGVAKLDLMLSANISPHQIRLGKSFRGVAEPYQQNTQINMCAKVDAEQWVKDLATKAFNDPAELPKGSIAFINTKVRLVSEDGFVYETDKVLLDTGANQPALSAEVHQHFKTEAANYKINSANGTQNWNSAVPNRTLACVIGDSEADGWATAPNWACTPHSNPAYNVILPIGTLRQMEALLDMKSYKCTYTSNAGNRVTISFASPQADGNRAVNVLDGGENGNEAAEPAPQDPQALTQHIYNLNPYENHDYRAHWHREFADGYRRAHGVSLNTFTRIKNVYDEFVDIINATGRPMNSERTWEFLRMLLGLHDVPVREWEDSEEEEALWILHLLEMEATVDYDLSPGERGALCRLREVMDHMEIDPASHREKVFQGALEGTRYFGGNFNQHIQQCDFCGFSCENHEDANRHPSHGRLEWIHPGCRLVRDNPPQHEPPPMFPPEHFTVRYATHMASRARQGPPQSDGSHGLDNGDTHEAFIGVTLMMENLHQNANHTTEAANEATINNLTADDLGTEEQPSATGEAKPDSEIEKSQPRADEVMKSDLATKKYPRGEVPTEEEVEAVLENKVTPFPQGTKVGDGPMSAENADPRSNDQVPLGRGPSDEAVPIYNKKSYGYTIEERPDITPEQYELIYARMEELKFCFAHTFEDLPGYKGADFDIEFTDEDAVAFQRWRSLTGPQKEFADKICQEMLDSGIIELAPPTDVKHCANVVIAPKKDPDTGQWTLLRFCVDLRNVNKLTKPMPRSFPIPEEMFLEIGHHQFYCALDLKAGFHQIKCTERAKHRLTFWWNGIAYRFTRMPFGAINSPAVFQNAVEAELNAHSSYAKVYIDDVLVWGDTVEEMMDRLEAVLRSLHARGLMAHPGKTTIFASGVEYLGFMLTKDGMKPQQCKVAAIKRIPRPTTKEEVLSFLGLITYYRWFIQRYSHIAAPLRDLTKKDANVMKDWGEEHDRAFEHIKELLCTEGVGLKRFSPDRPIFVHTDWSQLGLSAVLTQYYEEEDTEYLVLATSRSCNKHERRYPPFYGEMLASTWGINKLRPYLYGNYFTLITDHKPLLYLMHKPDGLSDMHQRWQMQLLEYSFDIIHRAGKEHANADVTSRFPVLPPFDDSGACLDPLNEADVKAAMLAPFEIQDVADPMALRAADRHIDFTADILQAEFAEMHAHAYLSAREADDVEGAHLEESQVTAPWKPTDSYADYLRDCFAQAQAELCSSVVAHAGGGKTEKSRQKNQM